ncbi:MAG: DM13 domain-containing protein [Acidimicrobiales bacterium]|nr:DM13 domain-containing protein [Acidimicrobiales bacterium]
MTEPFAPTDATEMPVSPPPDGRRSRRRWYLVAGGVAAAALVAWLAFGYFGVQAAFLDDEVDQAGPVFDSGAGANPVPAAAPGASDPEDAAETPPDSTPSTTAAAPVVERVVEGSFVDRSHPTGGQAVVLSDGTAQRFLRLEGFATDNGPDLNVYLSAAPPDAPEDAFDDDFVDLGDLQGNVGDQNYEVPADVDLDRYPTVVVWCVRFGVAFGAAGLA